jgi:hypothetical protein
MNNTDRSFEIYISSKSPGPAKHSNFLPGTARPFTLALHTHVPQDTAIKSQYQVPPVEKGVTNKACLEALLLGKVRSYRTLPMQSPIILFPIMPGFIIIGPIISDPTPPIIIPGRIGNCCDERTFPFPTSTIAL